MTSNHTQHHLAEKGRGKKKKKKAANTGNRTMDFFLCPLGAPTLHNAGKQADTKGWIPSPQELLKFSNWEKKSTLPFMF